MANVLSLACIDPEVSVHDRMSAPEAQRVRLLPCNSEVSGEWLRDGDAMMVRSSVTVLSHPAALVRVCVAVLLLAV